MSRKKSRNLSRAKRLSPLAGLVAMGITAPAFADKSVPFPTYVTGPQGNGVFVVSDGQIINPAGIQVDLGVRVRAKAIALNPNSATHTAAVLTLGTSTSDGDGAVEVFDTQTGKVLQHLPRLSVEYDDGLTRTQGKDGGGVGGGIRVQCDRLGADPDAEVDLDAGRVDDLAVAHDVSAFAPQRAGDVSRKWHGFIGECRCRNTYRHQAGQRTQPLHSR